MIIASFKRLAVLMMSATFVLKKVSCLGVWGEITAETPYFKMKRVGADPQAHSLKHPPV